MVSVEKLFKGEKMKMKFILLIVMAVSLNSKAHFALQNTGSDVDNPVVPVDNPVVDGGLPIPLNGSVALRAATDIYNCYSTEASVNNEFTLAELKSKASVHTYLGENLYGSGLLNVLSKVYGFKSVQTTYQIDNGGQLVISEHTFIGRGGGRGGRGGDLPGLGQKVISAKLIANEKEYYFNCN